MYTNYGHTLTLVVFCNTKSLHQRANYDDRYNEIYQQMSLNSRKRMQCLLEAAKYNGYHMPKLLVYDSHGMFSF